MGHGWFICRRGDQLFYTDNREHADWLAKTLNIESPTFNPES